MPQQKNNRVRVQHRGKKLEEKLNIEGRYFLFVYSADYTSEGHYGGEALEIFQVRKGKLEEIWHPCDHAFMNIISEEHSEKACKYLKKHGIKTVYTPGWTKDPSKFLNIKYDNYTDKDNWHKHDSLDEELGYWRGFLKIYNIELRVYNEEKPPKDFNGLLKHILRSATSQDQKGNAQ